MTAVVTSGVRVRPAEGAELAGWDGLVRRFENYRITHTRAWLQSLVACGFGTPRYLVFERDGEVVGCLPGLRSAVGPLRLFGSPRAGWQTVSMGPAFDEGRITTAELMTSLVPYLEEREGVRHIELMHNGLDHEAMRAAGFDAEPVFTYRAPLFPDDPERAFKNLKDSARRNVQRAQRLGLEVHFEHDEKFVDEHYAQLREVYARNRIAIPFGRQRVLSCFRCLKASGNLLAVSVYLPQSRVNIATGMFFIEGRELYLWMWAHWTRYRWYRPTELMTWTVMRRAMAEGCDSFEMMGGRDFKKNFGALPDETKVRWMRSRPHWLGAARRAAGAGYRFQQSLRGSARRAVARTQALFEDHRSPRRLEPACVLCDVDLVRALGLAGISSTVVMPPGDAARYSRHTRGVLPWVDAWDQPERQVEILVAYGRAQPEPPVLFYDCDATLMLVSRHREELRTAFRFVVGDQALVESLVNKASFHALASRHRLPVPPTREFAPGSEPPSDFDLPFPVIVKPLVRRPARWSLAAASAKALRLDSYAELMGAWPRLMTTGLGLLAQSLVPGDETRIESYHTYVDARGQVVAEFTGRKIRTWPASFGDSSALEISDAPDVRKLGRDIVRRLGLTGVAKLDFKRAPDDRLFLLEINARFNLWHHLGARAGVNIPALVYGDLTGRDRPKVGAARVGARWCKPWTDRLSARAAGVGAASWLGFTLGCDALRGFAWDDPLPLVRAGLARWLRSRRRARSPAQRTAISPRTA